MVPAGRPAAARAGSTASAMIASAVPSASDPIRITTVLPVRTTPAASANTLGRPSNTNATTPSGARRACTVQPGWPTSLNASLRPMAMSRQPRRPSTMAVRIDSVSASRVVERPRTDAATKSRWLAASTAATTASSLRRVAKPSKNPLICWSDTAPSPPNAARAAATACSARANWPAGMWSRSPLSATAMRRSPGANAAARASPTLTTRSLPTSTAWPASRRARGRGLDGWPLTRCSVGCGHEQRC